MENSDEKMKNNLCSLQQFMISTFQINVIFLYRKTEKKTEKKTTEKTENTTLRKRCSYSEFSGQYFPARIRTEIGEIFGPYAGKQGLEKLRIRTFFKQC